MKRGHNSSGFTIVELTIVIVVIAILATLVSTIYNNAQKQARDTALRDGAHKIAEAIQTWSAQNDGRMPRGGWGSTTTIGAAKECADGASGYFATTGYNCPLEHTLVASGYLPANFTANLTQGIPSGTSSFMVYAGWSNNAMVMYAMEDQTTADADQFTTQLAACHGGTAPASYAPRDTYNMRNGICIDL